MKEAAGEANMTVITIVLIGIVLAAGSIIVNNMVNSTKNKSKCAEQGLCVGAGGKCVSCDSVGTVTVDPN